MESKLLSECCVCRFKLNLRDITSAQFIDTVCEINLIDLTHVIIYIYSLL